MRFDTFRASSLKVAMEIAQAAFGGDVFVVRSGTYQQGEKKGVEIVVADAKQMEALMRRLDDERPPVQQAAMQNRPWILALVGPPGAGKTTTAVKLATHPNVFGQMKVGFLTLDTFRAGAIEQLDSYARVDGLPMQVIYDLSDVGPALRKLSACDVVIVDTPGRSPLSVEQNKRWRELLAAIRPDETHLVVPASLRTDAALVLCRAFIPHGITHMILTKADELPNGAGVLDIVAELDLRARWIASGQEVPFDLKPAKTGIPAAFEGSA